MTTTRTIASSFFDAFILDDSRHVSEHFYARRVSDGAHHRRDGLISGVYRYTAQFNNSSTYLDKV